MNRREIIAGLGSAVAWPLAARAQQAKLPVIGWLTFASGGTTAALLPFLQGLKETGYVEGQNVVVEYRYADYQYDRLPALAADLVRSRVAVIVTSGAAAAVAAKATTATIPLVFNTGGDPVAMGLVASLNRPGANVTGIADLLVELGPKRLQLLRELLPNAGRFGVLVEPMSYPDTQRRRARWACNSLLRMPLPIAMSKRPSQRSRNSALVRSWFTPGGNFRCWRPATCCPRSSQFVSSSWLAV
jgi:putative ABC transport system substrate-binding protein